MSPRSRSPSPSTSRTTARPTTPRCGIRRSPARCSTSSTRAACGARSSSSVRSPTRSPDLVREVAARGHEIGAPRLAARRRSPSSTEARSAATSPAARRCSRTSPAARSSGSGRPIFSLVPESRWALDVLARGRLHVLVERAPGAQPAVRRPEPARHAVPVAQRSGRAAVPGRPRRRLSGSRTWAASTSGRCPSRRAGRLAGSSARPAALDYCHPYDFDPDEPFWVVPEAGRLGSRLLWYNRRRTFARIEAALRGRAGPPLAERLAELARSLRRPATCEHARRPGTRRRERAIVQCESD